MEDNKIESIIFGLKETIAEQKADIERLKVAKEQTATNTAQDIWDDCIDKIMRGCGDDKEFWVIKILMETFKKYGVGFNEEV